MISIFLAALIQGIGTEYTFHSVNCHSVPLERINEDVEGIFKGWKAHSISTHHQNGDATFYVSIRRNDEYADVNVNCKEL